jgi:hypothetical protein
LENRFVGISFKFEVCGVKQGHSRRNRLELLPQQCTYDLKPPSLLSGQSIDEAIDEAIDEWTISFDGLHFEDLAIGFVDGK